MLSKCWLLGKQMNYEISSTHALRDSSVTKYMEALINIFSLASMCQAGS